MKIINLHTDGACSGNPGKGGWAFILEYKGNEKIGTGKEDYTTNNRMELVAAIQGLLAITEPCEVNLHTDSMYVVKAANEWLKNWVSKGWRNSSGEVKNRDLWESYYDLSRYHSIKAIHIKAHNGEYYNERCNKLAQALTK